MPRFNSHAGLAVLLPVYLLAAHGCDRQDSHPPPKPPAQQTVDDAMAQAAEAQRQAEAERRLRDIDRLRLEAQLAEAEGTVSLYRWMTGGLAVAMVICLLWLARELRLRRVLGHVIESVHESQGGDPSASSESPEGGWSSRGRS